MILSCSRSESESLIIHYMVFPESCGLERPFANAGVCSASITRARRWSIRT
jgi:hypothetical protein